LGEKSQSKKVTNRMSKEELPSIDDEIISDLPSVEDFITEENAEELPSVEEYIEKEEVVETVEEEVEQTTDLTEIVRLINDVRKDIPDIPEVKYYDAELEKLCEIVDQVRSEIPEVKSYDSDIEAICGEIDLVKENIQDLPEVKYYDEQVTLIEDRIDTLQTELTNLPEVKYYDKEIEAICGAIDDVKSQIPKFPKWVNEVNEVPDFSWIGKTFSVIDDDFIKVSDTIDGLQTKVDFDLNELSEDIDKKYFESSVKVTTLDEKVNTRIDEEKDKIWKELRASSLKIWEYHKEFKDDDKKLKKQVLGEYNSLKQNIKKELKEINHSSIKTDELLLKYFTELKGEISGLPEVKYYDEDLRHVRSDIKGLYKLVEDIKETNKILKEEQKLLSETNVPLGEDPPDTKNPDPLTPIDQNFVTLDQLQKHYKVFVERVQYQLASIGGGGAGFVKDLDDVDISGITTGSLLIYEASTQKWVGIASTALVGSGVGAGGTWSSNSIGISTTKNVGIGTTTAKSGVALFVAGDIEATNVNVAGTITYEDVKNVDSLGLSTFRSGIEVKTGSATTALLVQGDARIVGILTVGTASVTIDGDNNTVSVGIVTITNSEVILGDNVTLNAGATGINSAPNVLYVAKDGIDTNNGTSIDNAKLTIAGAVSIAQSGSVIKVLSGNYVESNPITLPAFVAVVGDDQRTVKVLPSNTTQDIFHVNKGCKLANMTFSGHLSPAAAVAFPTGIATNVGGGKWKGPYIQNCTSDTTTGTGIYIDGDKAEKTKSMNVDAFTQYNQGGVGVAVTNEGYAQLVSVFTICCDKAITVHKGGQADLANSNCSFGTFGLVANGLSNQQFIGTVTTSASSTQDNIIINVGSSTTRPYDGQVVYFDQLYKSVESISITNGGSGYTSTPSVTITSPTGPNGEVASAFATVEGGIVTEIDIISSGSQYTSTPTITISAPDSGTTSTATANMADTYYTINSSTPIVSGITTLTLAENLINTVGVASTAYFFQQSKIIASSHTFEYIGSGNTITLATPKRGGVTIQANEVVSENGGRVIYTSTDQAGNFRIGDDLQINQSTGTISGRAFSKSLFSEITPFILALG
jgi:hypothetical protein